MKSENEIILEIQNNVNRLNNLELLYNKYHNLIFKLSKKYSKSYDIEDLMQESYFALVDAVTSYTEDNEITFFSYLNNCINWHLYKYILQHSYQIALPEILAIKIIAYNKINNKFFTSLGRNASDVELRHYLKISQEELMKIKKISGINKIASLDTPIDFEDEDKTLLEIIPDDNNNIDSYIDSKYQEELSSLLQDEISKLDKDKSTLITEKYYNNKTYKEISESLNISQQKASELGRKALKELRENKNINDFLEMQLETDSYNCTGLGYFIRTGNSSVERAILRKLSKE